MGSGAEPARRDREGVRRRISAACRAGSVGTARWMELAARRGNTGAPGATNLLAWCRAGRAAHDAADCQAQSR